MRTYLSNSLLCNLDMAKGQGITLPPRKCLSGHNSYPKVYNIAWLNIKYTNVGPMSISRESLEWRHIFHVTFCTIIVIRATTEMNEPPGHEQSSTLIYFDCIDQVKSLHREFNHLPAKLFNCVSLKQSTTLTEWKLFRFDKNGGQRF